jgi:hypothetical protein
LVNLHYQNEKRCFRRILATSKVHELLPCKKV